MNWVITGPVTTVYIMGEGAPVIVNIKLLITGTGVVSDTALGVSLEKRRTQSLSARPNTSKHASGEIRWKGCEQDAS